MSTVRGLCSLHCLVMVRLPEGHLTHKKPVPLITCFQRFSFGKKQRENWLTQIHLENDHYDRDRWRDWRLIPVHHHLYCWNLGSLLR